MEAKRRKLDTQRIGDFIVKGLDAVHFRIVSDVSQITEEDSDKSEFFAPKFLYWVSKFPSHYSNLTVR